MRGEVFRGLKNVETRADKNGRYSVHNWNGNATYTQEKVSETE